MKWFQSQRDRTYLFSSALSETTELHKQKQLTYRLQKESISTHFEAGLIRTLGCLQAALLKLVEVPTDGLLELMADGSPERRLAIWVRVAAMSEEADVVENLRLIIEQNTQQLRAEREVRVQGLETVKVLCIAVYVVRTLCVVYMSAFSSATSQSTE
jgi:hypothetical protein